jgi:hypothetical protein
MTKYVYGRLELVLKSLMLRRGHVSAWVDLD